MEFRRINNLPPYVFSTINKLKVDARQAGEDVIDFGFGNPDLPSPEVAVEKIAEAASLKHNHRYSLSRGIPKLREAIAGYYDSRFGVELDPDSEVINVIGAKEGCTHLMWVLLQPGDSCLVPAPSYPIHIWGPIFAGAAIREVPLAPGDEFIDNLEQSWEYAWPKPKVLVISFPHNPTTICADIDFLTKIVNFAKEKDLVVVHDNAYADLGFDGYDPPSILQVPGAKDCCVELYSMTKSFSMAGWRVAFMVGNKEIVAALAKLKSYLDYGTFQPIQIAATVALQEAADHPKHVNKIYQERRNVLCDGLNKIGWEVERPQGTMFLWASIPEQYSHMSSVEMSSFLVKHANVATSPGVGFGPGGEGHIRFAMIENEQRTMQGIRNLKKALPDLG